MLQETTHSASPVFKTQFILSRLAEQYPSLERTSRAFQSSPNSRSVGLELQQLLKYFLRLVDESVSQSDLR